MPLGIISSDEFEKELSNCVSDNSIHTPNTPRASSITDISLDINQSNETEEINNQQAPEIVKANASEARGRGISNTQVPPALRMIIGETSAIHGRKDALDLADKFGISPSSVSAYNKGAHSTATINTPDKNTKQHIDASKLRVTKRATRRLNLALTHITEEKLADAKVGEIASVAKAMAGIIKDMEPSDSNENNKSNVPFVVFAPIIRNENTFEVVHAKDDY